MIERLRLIPVVVIDDAADARPLAAALKQGGLPCAEVTLRTPAAIEALRALAEDSELFVGAGTVIRPQQIEQALDAGARFIVTPGFSLAVVERCQELGVPVFPGVSTPTEVQMAYEAGLDVVKFFPAEASGGLSALRAIAAPYGMMRFIPTGGITLATCAAYLSEPCVLAVGGSWMVSRELLAAKRFDEVRQLVAEAVSLVPVPEAVG